MIEVVKRISLVVETRAGIGPVLYGIERCWIVFDGFISVSGLACLRSHIIYLYIYTHTHTHTHTHTQKENQTNSPRSYEVTTVHRYRSLAFNWG